MDITYIPQIYRTLTDLPFYRKISQYLPIKKSLLNSLPNSCLVAPPVQCRARWDIWRSDRVAEHFGGKVSSLVGLFLGLYFSVSQSLGHRGAFSKVQFALSFAPGFALACRRRRWVGGFWGEVFDVAFPCGEADMYSRGIEVNSPFTLLFRSSSQFAQSAYRCRIKAGPSNAISPFP